MMNPTTGAMIPVSDFSEPERLRAAAELGCRSDDLVLLEGPAASMDQVEVRARLGAKELAARKRRREQQRASRRANRRR